MAYSGSTATTPNPPICITPNVSGGKMGSTSVYARSRQIWFYNTSDGTTAVSSPGYFTDGLYLGMRVGDLLLAVCASTESSTGYQVSIGVLGTTLSTAGWNISTDSRLTSSGQ
jgi:hypothetical protein